MIFLNYMFYIYLILLSGYWFTYSYTHFKAIYTQKGNKLMVNYMNV
jgi:hypothetical protein